MNRFSTHIALFAYSALIVAVALWGVVFWVGWRVWNAEDVLALQVSDAEQVTVREASLMRLRALVRETSAERSELKNRSAYDVVQAVRAIENAGVAAGVSFEVSGASAEEVKNAKDPLRAVSVVVKAEDTFPKLTHALLLLEALPTPSKLARFSLEKKPGASSAWILTAHLRLFVLANDSL